MNRASIGQLLPWQPQNQCIELLPGQLDLSVPITPVKPALMQPALCQPDAVTIVHQHLQPVTAPVGEQPGMVRLRRTQPLHHVRQQAIGTTTHVYRHRCQPPLIDPDHRSQPRSHAAQASVA